MAEGLRTHSQRKKSQRLESLRIQPPVEPIDSIRKRRVFTTKIKTIEIAFMASTVSSASCIPLGTVVSYLSLSLSFGRFVIAFSIYIEIWIIDVRKQKLILHCMLRA